MKRIAAATLLAGVGYALAAGLMWGLVFVAPVMLERYPAALLSVARYLAFGLIALPLAVDGSRTASSPWAAPTGSRRCGCRWSATCCTTGCWRRRSRSLAHRCPR